MTKKLGFTLAEVLIVLGIIGVVAAMTIPTLMNNTGQAEFRTGFKKMLSTLSQAVEMNVALDNSDFSVLSDTTTTGNSIYNLFNTRMNVIKTETTDTTMGITGSNYTLFFNDGMVVSFPQSAASCTEASPCKALVDVNGVKKPNVLTTDSTAIKDQFAVEFYDQQVIPNGFASQSVMYSVAK